MLCQCENGMKNGCVSEDAWIFSHRCWQQAVTYLLARTAKIKMTTTSSTTKTSMVKKRGIRLPLLWFSAFCASVEYIEYQEERNSHILGMSVSPYRLPFYFSFALPLHVKLLLFVLLVAAYCQSLQETRSFVFSHFFSLSHANAHRVLGKLVFFARARCVVWLRSVPCCLVHRVLHILAFHCCCF